jgi:transcriptional regulator with GAF, ATPase, and Fis domain
MTPVACASSGSASNDLHPFEHLAVELSSCFSALLPEDVDGAVARALCDVGAAFGVDECTLIAFGEAGATRVVHSWTAIPLAPCTDQDIAQMKWLVQRLTRNAVVTITPSSDLPHAAEHDLECVQRSGLAARLAIPVVVGARVAFGLIVGSRHRHADWAVPVVERLRMVGEILGGGLARLWLEESPGRRAAVLEPVAEPPELEGQPASHEPQGQQVTGRIIGTSLPLRVALSRLEQVAPLDATVLLLGETGTGKELFASALHDASRRRANRLVRVNCAALPASLIESELFGHERGAFTGAISMRQGRFELADGGTIFLDEVGDLAPELQAKLLRVLQEGEFERVGSSKTRRVDVRVIAATHVDLEQAVADGRFRADLYYRLSVFPIILPALRERPEDIPPLVWFFIQRHQRHFGRRITSVPGDVMQVLQRHDWPGNVRELENIVARAMIRSTCGILELDAAPGASPGRPAPPVRTPPADIGDTLDALQRSHIERVLRECGWRINGAGNAAVRLGLHPNTLRFRMKKLGVVIPRRELRAASSEAHPG